jgi:hypothetical protein
VRLVAVSIVKHENMAASAVSFSLLLDALAIHLPAMTNLHNANDKLNI